MTNEEYVEHEVQLRLHDIQLKVLDKKYWELYVQLNGKLNMILGICGAIFTAVFIPIILHSLKLV